MEKASSHQPNHKPVQVHIFFRHHRLPQSTLPARASIAGWTTCEPGAGQFLAQGFDRQAWDPRKKKEEPYMRHSSSTASQASTPYCRGSTRSWPGSTCSRRALGGLTGSRSTFCQRASPHPASRHHRRLEPGRGHGRHGESRPAPGRRPGSSPMSRRTRLPRPGPREQRWQRMPLKARTRTSSFCFVLVNGKWYPAVLNLTSAG